MEPIESSPSESIKAQRDGALGIVVVSGYVATQMLSDVASLKIGVVFGLAVDMGTFIYPVTFTLRDLVHKRLGKKNARILIILAGLINLFMAFYLWWCARIPGDPSWGLQEEFRAVLMPVWRIVIASIVAEVISELLDTEIYHWFVHRVTPRHQWARVMVSNGLSIPVDNAIFAFGAFWGIVPADVIGQIWLMNLFVKYLITLVSVPMIYFVPEGSAIR
ncbi:queuosine precursor transporter [Thermodesulforhabdus norvegica]|uniref:Queuosine precursor transporter n=1 Tax=Thermodesulforhabdus norvegica TaxID=39841 RepID=A0A1I4RC88_9BACT|nr:queuosine precursor transporter [Thermodesulforhabdus norvegica]SFM49646.1 hypothetical protein SAMN05660836_00529 [Thermodesulforhabdus norvegica]